MLAYEIPRCSAEERDAALREFREVAAERRRLALRGARAVIVLARTGAYFHVGAASLAHFAELNGMSASEARELEDVGRALESEPSIAEDVARGTVPVASAAILGQLARAPELLRPEDRWLEWAKTRSTRVLRRLFFQRRDEVRTGEPVLPVTAYVTFAVKDDLERARDLASRAAHVALTLGQTLGIVVTDWLDDHDPLRKTPGVRRLPHTSTIPGSRYVPAEVDRAVRARSDDRCVVPFCDSSIWVQRSHRVPHREGSSREADALDLLCDYHHVLYERGSIRILGPPDDPVVTDSKGRRLDERYTFEADP